MKFCTPRFPGRLQDVYISPTLNLFLFLSGTWKNNTIPCAIHTGQQDHLTRGAKNEKRYIPLNGLGMTHEQHKRK